ncbi:MAG TPA: hypothetical protein VMT62_10655 [Syntrophorhabdaceae bacterium]|nr:hypothetical protein [Syntrophorhabdaceae bacterium]
MSNWEDCIVSYFDLIDTRKTIASENSEATELMRQLHALTHKSINIDMPFHRHAYAWNDSAIFLAFPKTNGDYETVMRELNEVKPRFDEIRHSYAICVKGQAIPEPPCAYGTEVNGQPKFIFLKASGYAFKNCFTVEERLKKHGMDWYIDSWITRKIRNFPKTDRCKVAMLPTNRKRAICILKGQIWR